MVDSNGFQMSPDLTGRAENQEMFVDFANILWKEPAEIQRLQFQFQWRALGSLCPFETSQIRFFGVRIAPPLALQPVTILARDSSATLIPLLNARDDQRVAFGVDLESLIPSLDGNSVMRSVMTADSSQSDPPLRLLLISERLLTIGRLDPV